MPLTKLASRVVPQVVWNTSGWNCTPQISRPSTRKAAQATLSVEAMMRKPSGSRVMVSP